MIKRRVQNAFQAYLTFLQNDSSNSEIKVKLEKPYGDGHITEYIIDNVHQTVDIEDVQSIEETHEVRIHTKTQGKDDDMVLLSLTIEAKEKSCSTKQTSTISWDIFIAFLCLINVIVILYFFFS